MNTMNPPDDEHNNARNMQRKLINIINKWCIKLEHDIKCAIQLHGNINWENRISIQEMAKYKQDYYIDE